MQEALSNGQAKPAAKPKRARKAKTEMHTVTVKAEDWVKASHLELSRAAVADDPGIEFRIVEPNVSGIHPTEFKVVIRPEEIETITKGGIIIPLSEAEKLQNAATEGTIVAVSPLAFTYEKWPAGYAPPKVGDRIIYSKYSGMKLKGKDRVEYIIMNDKDVVAVLA